MDNELDPVQASAVRSHLAVCFECACVCEELASILDVCGGESSSDLVPPNSHALWCRISNIIETEIKPQIQPPPEPPKSRLWRFSFAQLATAVVCIAIVSSMATIVAIRNYSRPPGDDITARSSANQTTFERFLSKVGLTETPQQIRERRWKEQLAAIDYWNARVQARRMQWDAATREAFDRNLRVIDESVNEYTMILQRDPEDDLSGEMLDSVMDDKMNLLRDFADL
jgi:hypothetical protein